MELAQTEIEVPAVIEQVLKDDGTPQASGNAVNVIRQKMSFVQFIVPTFYQWHHVQIDLHFDVEEVGTANGFTISAKRKLFDLIELEKTSASFGKQWAKDTKQADGTVDARLEHRPDITPPAPFLFRTGPTINFIPGEDTEAGGGTNLTVQVFKADGSPNNGQALKVSVNQGRYTAPDGLTTDDQGKVNIIIYKPNPNSPDRQTVTLSVLLGIVSARADVTI